MKANVKKFMAVIAATAMCAVPMTANADNAVLKADRSAKIVEKIELEKKPIVTRRPVVTGVPVTKIMPNTYTYIPTIKPRITEYTRVPVVSITFINPVTDPVGPRVDLKENIYVVDPSIKTTTVRAYID